LGAGGLGAGFLIGFLTGFLTGFFAGFFAGFLAGFLATFFAAFFAGLAAFFFFLAGISILLSGHDPESGSPKSGVAPLRSRFCKPRS
jgi:hypothetical protein